MCINVGGRLTYMYKMSINIIGIVAHIEDPMNSSSEERKYIYLINKLHAGKLNSNYTTNILTQ
jgi:hypothetical protein